MKDMLKTRSVWKVLLVALAIAFFAVVILAWLQDALTGMQLELDGEPISGSSVIFLAASSIVLLAGVFVVMIKLLNSSKNPKKIWYPPYDEFYRDDFKIQPPSGKTMSMKKFNERFPNLEKDMNKLR